MAASEERQHRAPSAAPIVPSAVCSWCHAPFQSACNPHPPCVRLESPTDSPAKRGKKRRNARRCTTRTTWQQGRDSERGDGEGGREKPRVRGEYRGGTAEKEKRKKKCKRSELKRSTSSSPHACYCDLFLTCTALYMATGCWLNRATMRAAKFSCCCCCCGVFFPLVAAVAVE